MSRPKAKATSDIAAKPELGDEPPAEAVILDDAAEQTNLVSLLLPLVPAADPAQRFWEACGGRLPSFDDLLLHSAAILDAFADLDLAHDAYGAVLYRCQRLPPISLPAVPPGF